MIAPSGSAIVCDQGPFTRESTLHLQVLNGLYAHLKLTVGLPADEGDQREVEAMSGEDAWHPGPAHLAYARLPLSGLAQVSYRCCQRQRWVVEVRAAPCTSIVKVV